ncbi:MAG: hypothetical protein ACKVS8_13975 [Phycisphaerales bacterium]
MVSRVLACSCAVVLSAAGVAAAAWNAAADFSATNNPNGAWTYGTRAETFSPDFFPLPSTVTNGDFAGWNDAANNVAGTPVVYKNFGPDSAVFGNFPAGRLAMHPSDTAFGATANQLVVVVRWTSPIDGDITVNGTWFGMDSGSKVATVLVDEGFTSSSAVVGGSTNHAFSLSATVHVGSTVDFAVSNFNGFSGDTTGLDAVIDVVPTPSAAAVLGLGCLASLRRRR